MRSAGREPAAGAGRLKPAYPKARRAAALATGLDRAAFPARCPFLEAEPLDPDYLPAAVCAGA